jgi:hypothetical protein
MRRNRLTGLATSLFLVTLLAACGTGVAAPTAAPTLEPSAPPAIPLGLFTGHDTCGSPEGDALVTCERTATDPRLTGTYEQKIVYGSGDDPKLFSQWSSFTMKHDVGGWTCKEINIGAMDGGVGYRDQVCTGDGGYAGLIAYIHSISGNAANDFGLLGWVEDTP